MKELLDKRTPNSKTFDLENGQHRLVARVNPMHYDNGGALEDIDMTIDHGGVHKCNYDIDLYPDKVGYHGTAPDGKAIHLILDEPFVEPVFDGNKVTYPEVSKDTDLQIVFLPTLIRVNRILKTKNAKKSCKYKVKREAGIKGKLLNLGVDAEGKKTKLVVTETPTGVTDEVEYEQTWTGSVAVMNPETRKKEWSKAEKDIKYPVTIDPTSTFTIGANADDGIVVYNRSASTASVMDTWVYNPVYDDGNFKNTAYLLFSGITIAQSTTITSATLNMNVASKSAVNGLDVILGAAQTPAKPATGWTVSWPTIGMSAQHVYEGWYRSGFTGSYSFGSAANFVPMAYDFTTGVQSLVNQWAYSNGKMVFYPNPSSLGGGSYNQVAIYARDWGTSKDAELVIDFVAAVVPPPPIKTEYNFG